MVDPESVIVTHLTEVTRRHADELPTRQETRKEKALYAISLDPDLEREIADAPVPTPEGEVLAIDPHRAAAMLRSLGDQVETLTRGDQRRPARRRAPAPGG